MQKQYIKITAAVLLTLLMGISVPALTASATEIGEEDPTIPGWDALQEIVGEGGQDTEIIVIGGENSQSSNSRPDGNVDMDYSGSVDDRTGAAASGSAFGAGEDYYVIEREKLAYDAEKGMYHILCGERGVYCNVPAGAVLSAGEELQFAAEDGVSFTIYQDGEPVKDLSQMSFRESGNYTVTISNHMETEETTAQFVILDSMVNDFKEYQLPVGFEYSKIIWNGKEKTLPYKNYYDFLEEGNYVLIWKHPVLGLEHRTEFTLDTTVPTLKLSMVQNGKTTEPVTFTDMEKNGYVRWIKDSRTSGTITDPNETLESIGSYRIRVYDEAGNYTEYSFVIEGYFDVNAVLAILLVLMLGTGFFLYCRRLRKHMRVG